MDNIDIPVASQILFTCLVNAILAGVLVFAYQKLVIERFLQTNLERLKAELQRSIQNEARQMRFIERQLDEFYSPMMGCLKKIQAKTLLRVKISKASDAAWREICERHPKPFLDHDKYFEPFMKTIRYENKEFREEIMPLYDNMMATFTDKYWLANSSTREWYSEFSAFVDLWHRWLDKTLPGEVVDKLGHQESNLKSFYQDLEKHIEILSKSLSEGLDNQ